MNSAEKTISENRKSVDLTERERMFEINEGEIL